MEIIDVADQYRPAHFIRRQLDVGVSWKEGFAPAWYNFGILTGHAQKLLGWTSLDFFF